MRILLGIAIGVFVAGMYFNPQETRQIIAQMADWVKAQVTDQDPIQRIKESSQIIVEELPNVVDTITD